MKTAISENTCPFCESDLTSDPIPSHHQQYYGGKAHYSRKIGVYDSERDRVTKWRCPDCGKQWDRV